jgi:hypothetical protein
LKKEIRIRASYPAIRYNLFLRPNQIIKRISASIGDARKAKLNFSSTLCGLFYPPLAEVSAFADGGGGISLFFTS